MFPLIVVRTKWNFPAPSSMNAPPDPFSLLLLPLTATAWLPDSVESVRFMVGFPAT